MHAKDILHSELNAFTSLAESQPEISVVGLGCSEGNGDDGGAGKGKGKSDDDGERNSNSGDNNNPGDSNPGDDPEDPEDTGNRDSLTPGISFKTQAKIFRGTNKSSSFEPFQVLGMNGELVVQVSILQFSGNTILQKIQAIPGQLKPKQLSKSHLEFRKLNFHGGASGGPAYEQVHVHVEIDVKDENTTINVLQPLKTPAYDQQTKETRGNRVTAGGTVAGSLGFLKPTGMVSVSVSGSKEVSFITEGTKNNSRITVDESSAGGVVAWGFCVDDENERQAGIEFGSQRALPSVDFEFFGELDGGPLPPIPEHFEVGVKSCWSLLSGRDGYTTSDWFSWFKGLGPGMAASKVPLYSNLCQAIILEVPSNLSQRTLFRSVSKVNESGVNTVVERPGLCKVVSYVGFEGPPIDSGELYSSLFCSRIIHITIIQFNMSSKGLYYTVLLSSTPRMVIGSLLLSKI